MAACPCPRAAVALLVVCLCLFVTSIPASASASEQPQPVTLFEVYNNTDCSGPLFTLDTTWQQFPSLNASEMAFLSAITTSNSTGLPCVVNWTSSAASSTFQCWDTGVFADTGYSGVSASGWTGAECNKAGGSRVYRYLSSIALTSNATLSSSGCHVGTVICPNCAPGTTVGMRIKCAIPTPSNNSAFASHSSSCAVLFALLLSLVALIVGCC